MLVYRGRGAVAARKRRTADDGSLHIALPRGAGADFLHVVQEYKHLGSIIACDGNLVPDARLRSSRAMSAYCPIAH
eukprot:6042275-Karenia_brevis.AAC.1